MAQHHRIDVADAERERIVVARFVTPAALDHPAVEQDLPSRGTKHMARAGDFSGGAVEFKLHA
jgi:hypothetical protein